MIWGDLSYYVLIIWICFSGLGYIVKKELLAISGLIAIYLSITSLTSESIVLAVIICCIGFYQLWSVLD